MENNIIEKNKPKKINVGATFNGKCEILKKALAPFTVNDISILEKNLQLDLSFMELYTFLLTVGI